MGENESKHENKPTEGLPLGVQLAVIVGIAALSVWGAIDVRDRWPPTLKGTVEYATAITDLALNVLAIYGLFNARAILDWIVERLIRLGVVRRISPTSSPPAPPAGRPRVNRFLGGLRPWRRGAGNERNQQDIPKSGPSSIGPMPHDARADVVQDRPGSSGETTSKPTPAAESSGALPDELHIGIIVAGVVVMVIVAWMLWGPGPTPLSVGPVGPGQREPPAAYCKPRGPVEWACPLPSGAGDATTTLASDFLRKPRKDNAVTCLANRIWVANAANFPGRTHREIEPGAEMVVSESVLRSEACPAID